jgi:ubiquitin-protein ligase
MQYYQNIQTSKSSSYDKIEWFLTKSYVKSYIKKMTIESEVIDIEYNVSNVQYKISIFLENKKPSCILCHLEDQISVYDRLMKKITKINCQIDLFEGVEDIVYIITYYLINLSKSPEQKTVVQEKNMFEFKEQIEQYKDSLKKNICLSKIMSTQSIAEMLGDQLIKIQSKKNYVVIMKDLQNFVIEMSGFKLEQKTTFNMDELKVILTIKLTNNFILEPPVLTLKSNCVLKNNILNVIEKLKPFTDKTKWSIKYSLFSTVENIYQMICKYGEIDELAKSPTDSLLTELEYLLSIKNENISENKLLLEFDELLANELAGFAQSNKSYWKAGTGYGSGNSESSNWNVEDYTRAIKLRKTKINDKLEIFFKTVNKQIIELNIIKIKSIFKSYMLDDELNQLSVQKIADIIVENKSQFVDVVGSGIISSIKEYFSENKIEHDIKKIQLNKEISQELSEYQKKFNEYKFKYSDTEFKSFHYSANSICSLTSNQVSRLEKEFRILKKSIILHQDASIFFCIEKSNVNKIRFIISGPKNTPYEYGLFIFDMCMSKDFPSTPPLVNLSNHGNKRFNPNLYACGKVCLSLLGTWRGDKNEMWNSSISTLYQLLISIQSQILVDEPFFNEPGYERSIGTKEGIANSKEYNYNIKQYTVDHAMCDLLSNDNYSEFMPVIKKYFKKQKSSIVKTLNSWLDTMPQTKATPFKESYNKLIRLIDAI